MVGDRRGRLHRLARGAGVPGRRASTSVVVDDLSSGHEEFVPADVPFVAASILDGELLLERVFASTTSTGVIHVAGFKYAGVSVQRPAAHLRAERHRHRGAARRDGRRRASTKIVFSSSAAVYGTPDVDLVTEDTPKHPESPYGESKLIGEWLLRDQAVAVGLRHTSLRYFNVVGSGDPALYDTSPHNLFPLVFDALRRRAARRASTATTTRRRTAPACATTSTSPTSRVSHVAAAQAPGRGRAARAGLQPRQRRRRLGRRDHGRGGRGHRHRLHPRGGAAPAGRPGAHRRLRRARRPRPRLADAAHASTTWCAAPGKHGRRRPDLPGTG